MTVVQTQSVDPPSEVPARSRRLRNRLLRASGRVAIFLLMFVAGAWATGAIYYSNLPVWWLRVILVATFALGFAAAFVMMRGRRRRVSAVFVACCAAVVAWFLLIPLPSGSGNYESLVATPARAEVDGERVTVRNVRDFRYRSVTDFDARYEDRTYDLRDLRTADLFVSYWGDVRRIAHTFVSFGFSDGRYLAVSAEVRLQRGEPYNPVRGLFKQYELIYVWGDERDLVRLRSDHRNEDVYLYRTTATPDEARLVLLDMLRETEQLAREPAFYNTVTRNCTTAIVGHVNGVLPRKIPLLQRRLSNGYSDSRAFANGWIASDAGFEQTRREARITDRARAAGDDGTFSQRIRTHLPEP